MLSVENLSKNYGSFELRIPRLDFPVGKTTVLIGPSGCGKSTLIRMLIGLLPADSGVIRFGSQEVNQQSAYLLRRRVGYVIQDGGLFPHLTGRDNALLMGRYLKHSEQELESRLQMLAETTKLPLDMLSKYPTQLSGGQKQRVSLIRALMLDPELLLMDEPLGALDPMIRYDLQSDLREIFRSLNKTVVMVTHDLDEAYYFGDKVVLLRKGNIEQEGSFSSLVGNPSSEFVQHFIRAQRSALSTLVEEANHE